MPLFKRVYFEIGNICNLHCPFCSPRVRPARQMNFAEFSGILEQLKPYTDYLYFHIKGEPLAHPLLEQFLAEAARQGFQVTITTNGTLLPQKGKLLIQSPAVRQVNLSLHSFSAHQGIDTDEYLDSCFAFARGMSAAGRYTTLRLWTLSDGRQADDGTRQILARIEQAFKVDGDLASMLQSRSVALGKGIFVTFDEQFEWPSLTSPFISKEGFCHGLRQMIGILADGTVVPCCLDADGSAPLGNVFEQPLSEILSSEPFVSAREGMFNRKVTLPLCQRCSYRTRFD